MTDSPFIFNRARVRQHRQRAAAHLSQHDFLLREMAERLCERLECVRRTFPVALDLGAHNGMVAELLGKRGGVKQLVQCDLSEKMMRRASGLRVVADEELLPFAPESFDLVISVWSLHWVNDLPGALIQIYRALKPEGMFLAMLPGGQTLAELRHALELAEQEVRGGISPRISPFVDVKDAGSLLQRAGFSLPVVDSELLTVRYENPFGLMLDLGGMGEANALASSARGLAPRALFPAAMQHYAEQYTDGQDGRVPATFELVTLTGWKG